MFNLAALIGSWNRGKGDGRFETANPSRQIFSPYDMPTELIQDMISRNVRPFVVQRQDLTAAGELEITVPGFHIVIYGDDNSANRAVNTTAYMELYWEKSSGHDTPYPLKHARGFSGPFSKLVLKWPAQSGVFVNIVVHTGMHQPWIDGESPT